MKPKIEHPHIFISYAWGSQEYQERVINLARSLVDNGIDVELDKWSLKEGNDTYSFMEQMVNNPNITNVLILLDKNYSEKANNRKGGVGTETQIISPEIYEKVNQEKFIPVVFMRGENDEIYKPTFLKSLLHFDLSTEDKYYSEFQRLVKRLYGIDVIAKPDLGSAPDWLMESKSTASFKSEFSSFANITNPKEKKHKINLYLQQITNSLIKETEEFVVTEDNYIECYKIIQFFRDKLVALVQTLLWFDGMASELSIFFESTKNNRIANGINNEMKDTLLHEMFVTVIALYLKYNIFDQIKYLVNKTYFNIVERDEPTSFNLFYTNNQALDAIVSKRDNKKYYSGTAQLWMETINTEIFNRSDLVAADIILYNIAVFGKNYLYHWWWFPITYVYDNDGKSVSNLFKKIVSKEELLVISDLFGFEKMDDFITNIKTKISDTSFKRNRYRYPAAWDDAPLLIDFIEPEKIGIYN